MFRNSGQPSLSDENVAIYTLDIDEAELSRPLAQNPRFLLDDKEKFILALAENSVSRDVHHLCQFAL